MKEFLRRVLPGARPPWDLPARRAGQRYLVLVRHGEAAAGWDADPDPGLSATGREQAEGMAEALGPLGPLPVVASPLRRTQETAAPLAQRWGVDVRTEPGVGEIVAPTSQAELEARAAWLRTAMAGRWPDLEPEHLAWRLAVLDSLRAVDVDTVVVTHFIAINVAVGEAAGDDRLVSFAPAHCSATFLGVEGNGRFSVLRLGDTATTRVL